MPALLIRMSRRVWVKCFLRAVRIEGREVWSRGTKVRGGGFGEEVEEAAASMRALAEAWERPEK